MRAEVPEPTMSQQHASDPPMAGEPHGLGDHGASHGHDDHGHDEVELGPVDWPAWGAGVLGVGLGLTVAWAFVLANLLATAR
ncbi:MAG: hypothetical protein QOF11_1467 [Chloroflexota bacterium]|nr:hypothetical protein [Chloroflexota bacterium]